MGPGQRDGLRGSEDAVGEWASAGPGDDQLLRGPRQPDVKQLAVADLVRFYPEHGPNHGFGEKLTVPTGSLQVCAYAINNGAGGHTFLGCRTAYVAPAIVDRGRAPFGNYESLTATAGGAVVGGWALDPDTASPISIHIYVDGVSAAYRADKSRADIAAAFGLGDLHGFTETIPMAPGAHTVCVYAINNGAGGHSFLACRSVTVW